MRISDWSSDVCSSDLVQSPEMPHVAPQIPQLALRRLVLRRQCDQLALPLDDGRLYSHAGDAKRERDPIALANLGSVIVLHRYPPSLATGGSDERRVGKECVSTCRSRWSP